EGEVEQPFHRVAGLLEEIAACFPAHHEKGEGDLQAEAPGNRLSADGAAIRGEKKRKGHHGEHTEDSDEAMHSVVAPFPALRKLRRAGNSFVLQGRSALRRADNFSD